VKTIFETLDDIRHRGDRVRQMINNGCVTAYVVDRLPDPSGCDGSNLRTSPLEELAGARFGALLARRLLDLDGKRLWPDEYVISDPAR
jgi:hypothetical protein